MLNLVCPGSLVDWMKSSQTRRERPTHGSAMQGWLQRSMAQIYGGLAQLGEHLLCKQGVIGSIPLASTISWVRREEWEVKREALYALLLTPYGVKVL